MSVYQSRKNEANGKLSKVANEQTNEQTNKHTVRQINIQTQTNKQTNISGNKRTIFIREKDKRRSKMF